MSEPSKEYVILMKKYMDAQDKLDIAIEALEVHAEYGSKVAKRALAKINSESDETENP